MATLLMYDPDWEETLLDLREKFRAQWLAARAASDSGKRREIKEDCYKTLDAMRRNRMGRYRTTAEVAERALNAVIYRATMAGLDHIMLPTSESFKTIAEIRIFLQLQNFYLARHKKVASLTNGKEAFERFVNNVCGTEAERYYPKNRYLVLGQILSRDDKCDFQFTKTGLPPKPSAPGGF